MPPKLVSALLSAPAGIVIALCFGAWNPLLVAVAFGIIKIFMHLLSGEQMPPWNKTSQRHQIETASAEQIGPPFDDTALCISEKEKALAGRGD
jgi:hypothetical protein